jgi:hypothetical protein
VVLGSTAVVMAYDSGDMNCDGVVDNGDCTVMALAMTDPGGYAAAYPNCTVGNADLNGDGLIDCVDFPLFIAAVALTSPGGCGFMDCPLQPDAIFAVGSGPEPDVKPELACSQASTTCLVVWQASSPPLIASIWGRMAGIDGVAFGEPFRISAAATNQQTPSVEHDPVRNRFLVVWQSEYELNPADNDIYARFIPISGPDPSEPPFPVSTAFDHQFSPRLAYAPGVDEFLVVWTSDDFTNPYKIVGRRVYADGSGFPTGDLILSEGPQHRHGGALAWDDLNSRYILAYTRFETSTAEDVWLRRISWSGAQIGIETGIAAWPGAESLVDLDVFHGAPLVAWLGGDRAYARWVDSDGLPAGPPLDLTDGGTGVAHESSVACDEHGAGCRVAWGWYDTTSGFTWDIFDRQVSTNGSLGPIEVIRMSPVSLDLYSFRPRAEAVNGSIMRVWSQETPPGSGSNTYDIHGRVFRALLFDDGFESGDTLWWTATVGD